MQIPGWLSSVHHDGSEKYISNLYPRLGEKVHVKLRTGMHSPLRRVLLRTFPDGEQALCEMQAGSIDPPVRWWHADLEINQPLVHYRFLLQADDGVWMYSGRGATAHDPLDVFDFRILADYQPPEWIFESVFYQIFPDRFANGEPANDPKPGEYEFRGYRPQTYPWGSLPEPGQHPSIAFYGGDLQGIIQHIDYLERLGVNALYLTPVFTAYSNHKYDVIDFEHVDPHFGGDEALIALRRILNEKNMHLILDIVPNHAGYWHSWFQSARQDPAALEAEFFTFNQHPDDYLSWLGVWTLPKLNYSSLELRERIFAGKDSVFRRWLRPPYAVDGWRVDVANMLARQGAFQMGAQIAQGIRQAVKETNSQAYLIGENFFDASSQLQGDAWDGVMNYAGFMTPLLHWLRGYRQGAQGLREMVTTDLSYPTTALETAWRERRAAIPWTLAVQQYNLLGSHDTQRICSLLGENDGLQRLAAILLFTYPGVPGIYYGDEIGMLELPFLAQRGCMLWDEQRWDHDLFRIYQQLTALRRSSKVLQQGGFQMLAVEQDLLAFQRELGNARALVIAQRSPQTRQASGLFVENGGIRDGIIFQEVFSKAEVMVKDGYLMLPQLPQGGTLWLAED